MENISQGSGKKVAMNQRIYKFSRRFLEKVVISDKSRIQYKKEKAMVVQRVSLILLKEPSLWSYQI